MTYQNKNINKNEILQKQQTVSKQSVSKMQESLKKNASMFNFAVYKNKTLEETDKANNDLLLNEEERNKKIIDEKQYHQKANSNCNFKITCNAMQNKNSTFTNLMQSKSMLRNIEHTADYGRNPSYNDSGFGNKSIGNAECKNIIRSEYISTNVFPKSSVKSTTLHEKDTLACNDENNVNFAHAKTYLTEDKKCANLSINHIRKQELFLEQCYKEMKKIDKSKVNINQRNREINNATDNEQTNSFKHSSNLLFNKCTVETPADAIHRYSLKLEYSQDMDDVKKLGNSRTTWNNCLSNNTVQKNATVVNPLQSIQNMRFDVQQTIMQARDQTKQMPSWESNSNKFYNHFSIINATQPSQILNTFNVASYESNIQTLNDKDAPNILKTAMNYNKENLDILYKYTPNIQQRSGTTFSDFTGHSILSGQTSKWNPFVQDSFHIGPYNTTQTYNSGTFDPDNFNNTHMNCLPHPIIYAPFPNVQNPQLQYLLPVSYNSPCTNYICVIPNTTQLNNFNNINSMHDQQFKYIPCMQMNNYIRDTHSDLSNCTIQARNAVNNVPMKSNEHYKKCRDNSRMVYNDARYVRPLSHSGFQQGMNFMSAIDKNQCSNEYLRQKQKNNQNTVNYMQMSKYPKSQAIQDPCDESENIPPIISPKEFITNNVSFSNKTDQLTARV